mmetsp:Transcript_58877/g.139094  ORF Transcript_58877/g.139094 Transcript_58877/m.139094 type:complete len:310 (-) Transcript_58877:170-1099(-)
MSLRRGEISNGSVFRASSGALLEVGEISPTPLARARARRASMPAVGSMATLADLLAVDPRAGQPGPATPAMSLFRRELSMPVKTNGAASGAVRRERSWAGKTDGLGEQGAGWLALRSSVVAGDAFPLVVTPRTRRMSLQGLSSTESFFAKETERRVLQMVNEEEDEVARLRTPGNAAKEQVIEEVLRQMRGSGPLEELSEALRTLDAKRTGLVTAEDFRRVCQANFTFTERHVQFLIFMASSHRTEDSEGREMVKYEKTLKKLVLARNRKMGELQNAVSERAIATDQVRVLVQKRRMPAPKGGEKGQKR